MLASLQLLLLIFSHVYITYTSAVDARLNLKQVRSRGRLLPILNFEENPAMYYPLLDPWVIAETPEVLAAAKKLRLAQ